MGGYPTAPMGYGYPAQGYYQPPMYPQMYQPQMYQPQVYPGPGYYPPAGYNPNAAYPPQVLPRTTNLDRSVPKSTSTLASPGAAPWAAGGGSTSTGTSTKADPSVPRPLPSADGSTPPPVPPPGKSLPSVPYAPPGASTPIGDCLPPPPYEPAYQDGEDWPQDAGRHSHGKDGEDGHLPKELMIGDIGWNAWRLATANGGLVRVPLSGIGSFKASDDDSPRPMTRVYFGYDYFDAITDGSGHPFTLHRETAGFEYAFLDGRVSVGARVPVFHQIGDSFNQNEVGDVTAILKIAPYLCKDTGNVISLGVAVTAPTGPEYDLADGTHISPTLIEPFIAGMYNLDRFYVMGFSSITVPTSSQDVTLWSNDVGFGYRLYSADGQRFITGISPTIEWHLNTPLNHSGLNAPGVVLTFPEEVFVVTGGVHFMVRERGVLTIGAATPIIGPKPYDVQAIVQFNLLF
jgi:hypothetical protein